MADRRAKKKATIKSIQVMLLLAVIWLPFVFFQLRYSHSLLVKKINDTLQARSRYLSQMMQHEGRRLSHFCQTIQQTALTDKSPEPYFRNLAAIEDQFLFHSGWMRSWYWESAEGLVWASDSANAPGVRLTGDRMTSYAEMRAAFNAQGASRPRSAMVFAQKSTERPDSVLQIVSEIGGLEFEDHLFVGVIDIQRLLDNCDLLDGHSSMPLKALIKDESGKRILGDPEIESLHPCLAEATLPGTKWRLMVVPIKGWLQPFMTDLLVYGLLGAAMLAGSGGTMWVVTYRHQITNNALTDTRDALILANERLAEDVNLRRKAERALQESEYRFRNIYDRAAIGVVVIDATRGQFLQVNPIAETIFGRTESELRNLVIKDVLVSAHGEPIALLPEPKQSALEFIVRRPDGNECWGRVTVNDLSPPSAITPRQILVIDEITDRKRAELRQKQMESQLIQAQKMEAVGTLAGGVAHDFNNMLQVIIGYCDILLSRLTTENWITDNVVQIRRAARRSADLTKQLLTFAMQQEAAPRTVDMFDAIPRILKLIQPVIGADTELRWLPSPELHPIEVDPSQLDQIMANLLMNARHAIERNGQITITAQNIAAGQRVFADIPVSEHDSVALIVHDNGCGMTPEVQSRMFDPFFTTRDPGKGTGLGLSTVYGLVSQNNARIYVDSQPQQGTRIVMVFRRAFEQQSVSDTDSPELNSGLQGTETILLAEDHTELLTILQSELSRQGYRVLMAHSADEAIQISQRTTSTIHLLLTDMIMPGLNVRRLAEQLKKDRPHLKVLFMSGYAMEVVTGRALLPPDAKVIQKPFPPGQLLRQIREILDQQAVRRNTPSPTNA